MPIFEFRCGRCDGEFERLLFSRSAAVRCPGCGATELERLPSRFAAAGTDKKVGGRQSCAGCRSASCSSCGSA